MCKATGTEVRQTFFSVLMTEAFITKVNRAPPTKATCSQKVEMVFKTIEIEYFQQGVDRQDARGLLTKAGKFDWDIPPASPIPTGRLSS